MRIRAGFKITYECPTSSPMLLMLSVHPTRRADLETPDTPTIEPRVPLRRYDDAFGNICYRILAPAGRLTLSAQFVIRDDGLADAYAPEARQVAVEDIPDAAVVYLLGSRYCDRQIERRGLVVVWRNPAGLASGAGHSRLRP